METLEKSSNNQKRKVWCDGCYDLAHFGHANSLRQAKALGDYLIVGVHTDEEIAKHKGQPVFSFEERCQLVEGIKWVDKVVRGAPYTTCLSTLDKYECDFCCHGDDVTCTAEGIDTYEEIKAAGRYREVQRTSGVSTTGLVKRILKKWTKNQHDDEITESEENKEEVGEAESPWTGCENFYLTTEKLNQFTYNIKPKLDEDIVVYVAGSFDLFHLGHLKFLEQAKSLGDYLIVGLHSNHLVNRYKGGNYPIMSLHERLLGVLACKYVSEVIMDAPFVITKGFVSMFNIDIVADGQNCNLNGDISEWGDPYKYVKESRKFIPVNSGSDMTTENIVQRILDNRLQYEARNAKKELKEIELINGLEEKNKIEQKQENAPLSPQTLQTK